MPSMFDEHAQFTDTDGTPLVNGYLYIGTRGADPKLNPITIYSDRALATTIANPQRLDAYGKAVNKIWIPGRYSYKVEDVNNVQIEQELDNGEESDAAFQKLTNVLGIDAITAEGSPAITSYVDGEVYVFRAVSDNTGAVTLDVGPGAKSLVKNGGEALEKADIESGQMLAAVYNATDDNIELLNPSSRIFRAKVGSDLTAAASLGVNADGGIFDILTGTNITSFAAKAVGSRLLLHLDADTTFEHDATNLVLPGGLDLAAKAGEELEFYEYATGDWRLTSYLQNKYQQLPYQFLAVDAGTGSPGSHTHTGIPTWVRRIAIKFVDVSITGTNDIYLKMISNSGVSSASYGGVRATSGADAAFTTEFNLCTSSGTGVFFTGTIYLEMSDLTVNEWSADWRIARTVNVVLFHGTGSWGLGGSEVVSGFEISTSGADTFDAGQIYGWYLA